MSMYKFNYVIPEEFNNKTVLDYISSFGLGNEKLKALKNEKTIYIDNQVSSLKSLLTTGNTLTLLFKEEDAIPAYKSHLDIILEDEYLLIINKAPGVAVHTDGAKYTVNTLANMVSYYYKSKGYNIPVWYLHRLDFDTSGIIVFCKDPLSMAKLSYELSHHDFRRDYLALVSGIYNESEVINLPIGRDRHVNGKYRVSDTGKEAITEVDVVKKFKRYTLVRLSLKTGRTHQIRVHMAYKGHPLLGDALYGGGNRYIERQALHSCYISFMHPIYNKLVELDLALPKDMKKLVEL